MEDGVILAVGDEHQDDVRGSEEGSVGDSPVMVPYDTFAVEV